MNKWIKKLTAALCAAVLMCGMAVTAYAGGGDMGYPRKIGRFCGERRSNGAERMLAARRAQRRGVCDDEGRPCPGGAAAHGNR